MGGCASSLLASLYCSWRELLYVSAHRCNLNMFRYIDDLIHARKPLEPSILHCFDYGIVFGSVETNLHSVPLVGITTGNFTPQSTCAKDSSWRSIVILSVYHTLPPLWLLTHLPRFCAVLFAEPGPSPLLDPLSRNRLV